MFVGLHFLPESLTVKEPRSEPLRSRAMGLCLEEACELEW